MEVETKTHSHLPCYREDHDGKPMSDAFVIAIAGGSASGKTSMARRLARSLGAIAVILSQDSFYKPLSREDVALANAYEFNFDHEDAFDMPLFASCLADLKARRQTIVPVYSFVQNQRTEEIECLHGASIVIVEGILTLLDSNMRAMYDLKVFLECDPDLLLVRKIRRDIKERRRNLEGILKQYFRFVKPSYESLIHPTSKYADIVVPAASNAVALESIVTYARRQLGHRWCPF